MAKQTKSKTGAAGGAARPRKTPILAGGLLLAAIAVAGLDLVRERSAALASGEAELQATGRVAEALVGAEDARIQALLARLRIELRSNGGFAAFGAAGEKGVDAGIVRRIDNLLRRALEGTPEIVAFDFVVAGQDGIQGLHFDPATAPLREVESGSEAADRAKELWYADEVVEAVEAKGRRIVRGAVTVEAFGEGQRALARAVIALHDDEDVVQGALVATLDHVPLGTRLASLSTEAVRFALVTGQGARIAGTAEVASESVANRVAAALAVEADAEAAPAIAAEGGVRSLVRPASAEDTGGGALYFWIETDEPAPLWRAGLLGPWPLALAGLGLLVGVSVSRPGAIAGAAGTPMAAARGVGRAAAALASRRPAAEQNGSALDGAGSGAEGSEGDEPAIRRERFVLRDWLADVRGCLEREAASRGLTLVLRCDRALPREIEQDPHWLGGLLVSLGREALDATSATRVALEVRGGDDRALRFDLDAGEADLEPVGGMTAIAGRLGGAFEKGARGRLALVIPGALA